MENKNLIPYIITITGTLQTDSDKLENMKEELLNTNIQYLIIKANTKTVEFDEEEFKKINPENGGQ